MVKSIPKQLLTALMPFFDLVPPVIHAAPEQGSGSMFFNLMKQITEATQSFKGLQCAMCGDYFFSSCPIVDYYLNTA